MMPRLKVYAFLVCLMLRAGLSAQSPNVSWYSVNEGLSQSMVTCFYKDKKGIVWIGTGDGLNSFDGKNFVKYRKNLPNSQGMENSTIRQICEDDQGELWVVTDIAVYRFHPSSGKFDELLNVSMKIGGWKILDFRNGRARIYSSGRGVFYYHANTGKLDTSGLSWNSMPRDYVVQGFGEDVVMIAGPDGVYRMVCNENKSKSLQKLVSGECHVMKEINGKMISSWNDKLVVIDRHFSLSYILLPEEIFSVAPYDVRHLLVGTARSMFLVDIVTGEVGEVNMGNRKHQVKVLWKDNGNIWIGTDGAGFGIWSPHRNKFRHISLQSAAEGRPNSVFGVLALEKYIWHGVHERGIIVTDFAGHVKSELRGPGNCFEGSFLSLRKFDNSIYAGSCFGLFSIDENSLKIRKLTPFSDTVVDIVKSGNRLFTFGWTVKEYALNGKELVFRKSYRHNSLSVSRVKYAVSQQGKIWGTDGLIVFSMDESAGNFKEYRFPENFPRILSFAFTGENDIILATYNGIYVYKDLNVRNGPGHHLLEGEIIYGILRASGGKLWCTSNSGIFVLDSKYRLLNHFTIADGLQSLEFNSRAFARSERGLLVFGGINGTNTVHEDSVIINAEAPVIRVSSVFVNEHELPPSSYASALRFDYDENVFSAKISAMEYAIPERVKYRYKLEGWDNTWSNPTASGYVRYAGTSPGEYSLFAMACNGDGVWSKPLLLFHVQVIPPWWATWWFRIAMAITLVSLGAMVIRHMARRKLKKKLEIMEKQQMLEAERSRISRDMHDDIGVELTKINLLSKQVLMRGNDADGSMRKITYTSNMLIQNMREIIWALNTNNDNLGITSAYLHEYALNLLEEHDAQLKFVARIQDESVVLGANARRNMFLVYKEALNNILKHSGAKEINVMLEQNENAITLLISDDGKGFGVMEPRTGANGLVNMQARAREISGSVELSSVPGNGSIVKLHIPVLGT